MVGLTILCLTMLMPVDSLNVRYVGGWTFGPRVNAVEVDESRSLLFSNAEGGIYIWDISNPANPSRLKEISTFGTVSDIFYDSTRQMLFVADYNGGLEIWDVSEPSNAHFVSRYFNRHYPYAVYVQGDYAYIADGDLTVVDISDPSNPHEVARLTMGGTTRDIVVRGHFAYMAGGPLFIVDVSNPQNPTLVSQTYLNWGSSKLDVVDTLAYVADMFIDVVNVTNPLNPHIVGTFDYPGIVCNDVDVVGNFIYAATDSGLGVIDASDLDSIRLIASYNLPNRAGKVVSFGHYVFVADGMLLEPMHSALYAFDVSQPSSPVQIWQHLAPDEPKSIFVEGNRAYLATYSTGIYVLDITAPSDIHELAHYDTPGHADGVYVEDSYAYVADHNSLLILDVSDPGNIHEVGRFAHAPCFFTDVVVKNNIAVTAGLNFWAIDVSDPTNPVGLNMGQGYVLSVVSADIQGHYGYAFAEPDTVLIYDLSNIPTPPDTFWPISGCSLGGTVLSGSVSDSMAVAVTEFRNDGIVLLGDPENLHEIGSIVPSAFTYHAVIQGNRVFTGAEGGLYIYDISDLSNPTLAGYYQWMDMNIHRLFATENRIYAVSGYGGFRIFDYSPQTISEQEIPVQKPLIEVTLEGERPVVRFELPNVEETSVSVFDVAGRLVWRKLLHPVESSVNMELPSVLRPGVYLVEVKSAHFAANSKLIVLK